jgi:L-ascorbate metabolism protein UlaG (beta-lactamase superfamily)
MKRRRFLRYTQAALISGLGTGIASQFQSSQAQGGSLGVQFLGHSCVLFSGSGQRILVNPFQRIGCTKNYPAPRVSADIVMISSRLLDEGYIEGLPGRPKLLFEAGIYKVNGLQIQGVRTAHDRNGGFRFGNNVCWLWTQGGVRILHLGGTASPITLEQKILMGRPDILFVPVGGGDALYTPEEAKAAIAMLEPRIVVPTHFRTSAADPKTCTIEKIDAFLSLMKGTPVRRGGASIGLSKGSLPGSMVIQVMG